MTHPLEDSLTAGPCRKRGGTGPTLIVAVLLVITGVSGCRENAGFPDPVPENFLITYADTSLTCPSLTLAVTEPERVVTLVWSVTPGATMYFLEEDHDPNFSSPRELYRGPLRSADLGVLSRNRPWYFRSRGAHQISTSPWSNIVGYSTTVTLSLKGVSPVD